MTCYAAKIVANLLEIKIRSTVVKLKLNIELKQMQQHLAAATTEASISTVRHRLNVAGFKTRTTTLPKSQEKSAPVCSQYI